MNYICIGCNAPLINGATKHKAGCQYGPKPPDLLSLADQLAEAARKMANRRTYQNAEEYNEGLDLRVALAAWDAARKGR